MRIIGTVLVLVALFYPGSMAQAAECERAEEVRIGAWPPTLNDVPFWYARDKGLFEDHCLDVELVIMTQTAEHAVALSQGDVDGLIAATPVEGLLTKESTGLGRPVLAISTAKGATYALVGYLPDRSGRTVSALLGQRVAVFRCSWQGLGDVTDVADKSDGGESASPLTDMLVVFLHEQIAAGHLPSGTRIYCGEPPDGDLKPDTIYLAEVGGGAKRFAELQLAPERDEDIRIAFGMITVPGHFALVPAEGDSDFAVLAYPESFRLSDGYLVVMEGKMADEEFRRKMGRLAAASSDAVAALQDEVVATAYMLELASSIPGGSLSFPSEREALLTAKMGIGLWQTVCPTEEEVDGYIKGSGLHGVIDYSALVRCLIE